MGNILSDLPDLDKLRSKKAYKECLRRFNNKLYFNKNFRESFLKTTHETRDNLLIELEKIPPAKTLKEAKERLEYEKLLDVLTRWDSTHQFVEEYLKEDAVTDGRFILYRRNREAVFILAYRKGGKKKLRHAYLYLKGGIPANARKRGELKKETKFNLAGFSETDRGTSTQVRRSCERAILRYRGRKLYRFIIYMQAKDPEKLWVERKIPKK